MSTPDERIVGAKEPPTSALLAKCATISVRTHHPIVLKLLSLRIVLAFAAGERRRRRKQKSGGF